MKMLLLGVCLFMTSLGAVVLAQDSPSTPLQQKVIILLGPPGSGKGTQAARLTKELAIPHISTGDLFRENISKNTELGRRAKSFMDTGKLVPDEVVLDMLFDRIARPDCASGYLLDGFPRTIPQAEAFSKVLPGSAYLIVLNLDVPDEIIIKRAEGRLTCKQCGSVYNKYFSPPSKDGCCNQCDGQLIRRPDDQPEVVKERLRVYNAQTLPLIDYYNQKGKLYRVDGTQTPDQVYHALLSQIVIKK